MSWGPLIKVIGIEFDNFGIALAIGSQLPCNYVEMQMGNVPATWANADLLQRLTGYKLQTDFRHGIDRFVEWFQDYYGKHP